MGNLLAGVTGRTQPIAELKALEWTGFSCDMDYLIAMATQRVYDSYWHTPMVYGHSRRIFHSVLRAGRTRLAREHQLESWLYPGHDLILSRVGVGVVRIANRVFRINEGELIWIDYNRSHRNVEWLERPGAWELVFVRVDSSQMDLIAETLDVQADPMFRLRSASEGFEALKRIFRVLRERPVAMDAQLSACVSALVAQLFESRHLMPFGRAGGNSLGEPDNDEDAGAITRALDAMRQEYDRPWTSSSLARLTGFSVPQFYRRFRRAAAESPIEWLRRERINQAKRNLIETNKPIRQIAIEVGYSDALYFSRDFRKVVGVAPKQYRLREQVQAAAKRGA